MSSSSPADRQAQCLEVTQDETDDLSRSLLDLLTALIAQDYRFFTPTPETHAKVLQRLASQTDEARHTVSRSSAKKDDVLRNILLLRASTLEELWGWSLPVTVDVARSLLVKYLHGGDDQIDTVSSNLLLAPARHGIAQGDSSEIQLRLLLPQVRVSNLYLPQIRPSPFGVSDDQARKRFYEEVATRRSRVLYAHSAFPTSDRDSVFFGPDTYRFVRFLHEALAVLSPPAQAQQWQLAVDVGTGAGAGAVALAGLRGVDGRLGTDAEDVLVRRVIGTDINPKALQYARANAQSYAAAFSEDLKATETTGIAVDLGPGRLDWRLSSLLSGLSKNERAQVDLIVSNPPFIAFGAKEAGGAPRFEEGSKSALKLGGGATYADGGSLGIALPLLILRQAIDILRPGGLLLLYTGVPILMATAGSVSQPQNLLWSACQELRSLAVIEYWDTIDTDIFGDEMAPGGTTGSSGYDGTRVGRIEVVGVALRKAALDS